MPKKQVNKKSSTLRECVWCVWGVCVLGVCMCVCLVCACMVCVCVLDREGTWVYSSVSTALVVVNMDSFVSDRLQ